MTQSIERERRPTRRVLIVMVIVVAVVTLALWNASQDNWWKIQSFGCPQGFVRVNGGGPMNIGACGGLIGEGQPIHVTVGSTIDIHLFGYGRIATSNPTVVRGILRFFRSSQTFKAISVGTALLTTSRKGAWGCSAMFPIPITVPKTQATGEECPVLNVMVSPPKG